MRPHLVLFPRRAPSSVLRESLLRPSITATLGELLGLHDKQHRASWWWPSDRFYLAHTVRTRRIEPDAVLPGHQVLFSLERNSTGCFLAKKHSNSEYCVHLPYLDEAPLR